MAHAKHKRVLKLAKGYRGRRKSTIKAAKQAVDRALSNRYRSRKLARRRKRSCAVKLVNSWARGRRLSFKHMMFGLRSLGLAYNVATMASLTRFEGGCDALLDLFVLHTRGACSAARCAPSTAR